jgi:hypothetical protein
MSVQRRPSSQEFTPSEMGFNGQFGSSNPEPRMSARVMESKNSPPAYVVRSTSVNGLIGDGIDGLLFAKSGCEQSQQADP